MKKINEITFGCGSDMELLQYLRNKGNDRFSKIDAFCDLIDRITDRACPKEEDDSDLLLPFHYGTFQTSVSELAETWRWHRATVRSFLDKLESLGYLKKELTGRDYTFYIRLCTGVSVPVNEREQIRTLLIHMLQNYDYYNISSEQFVSYLELYYVDVAESYDGDDLVNDLAEHKAELIVESLSNMEYSMCNISHKDEITALVTETFKNPLNWTWYKWLEALKTLDFALAGGTSPSFDVSQNNQRSPSVNTGTISLQDAALLDKIFKLASDRDSSHSDDENTDNKQQI